QFFVTEGPSRHLDFNHTIFGYLTEGEDVREAISNISVTGETPNFSITMETVDVFSDLENGTLVLTAAEGYTGSSTITVTVADQNGNTSQREFQVHVTPDAISHLSASENANPYLSDIPTLQVTPGATITYQLTATDIDLNATNGNTYFVFMDQSY